MCVTRGWVQHKQTLGNLNTSLSEPSDYWFASSTAFSSLSSAGDFNPSCWFCSSEHSYVHMFHFRSDMLPMNSRNKFPDGLSRVMLITHATGSSFEKSLFSSLSFPSLSSSSSWSEKWSPWGHQSICVLTLDVSKWLLYIKIHNHVPEKTLKSCKLPTGGWRTSWNSGMLIVQASKWMSWRSKWWKILTVYMVPSAVSRILC